MQTNNAVDPKAADGGRSSKNDAPRPKKDGAASDKPRKKNLSYSDKVHSA